MLAWLEKKNQKRCTVRPRPLSGSTCWYGTPPKLSSNANNLVPDENTRDVMVWLIKAYDYNQNRVLSVLFCRRYMGPPFISRAISIYGVP